MLLFKLANSAIGVVSSELPAYLSATICSGSLFAAAEGHWSFATDLAIWTGVVFLALVLVLWWFAGGPVSGALRQRERAIVENIAAAERTRQEAERLLADYETRLAGVAEQIRQLIEEGKRDAEATRVQVLEEAREGAQAERDRAVRDISIATDGALKQLAQASADASVALAATVIRQKLTAADQERMVQEALGRFAQSEPSHN